MVGGGISMSEGGFVVKFEGAKEKPKRCYACKFDYDEFSYEINDRRKKPIPRQTRKIQIKIEA